MMGTTNFKLQIHTNTIRDRIIVHHKNVKLHVFEDVNEQKTRLIFFICC